MDGNLTLDELYAAANEMCRKWWGVDYTGTIRLVDADWKRRWAVFRFSRNDNSLREIRMSRKVNAKLSRSTVLDNLLHELVHWRIFTETWRQHGTAKASAAADDGSPEFVRECLRVGASLSGTNKARHAAKLYGGVTQ